MDDEHYMRLALEQAQIAGSRGDVPVGAIIVRAEQVGAEQLVASGAREQHVVASGYNQRQSSGDPTSHAEMIVLRAASVAIGNWRIEGTMYVTQEPCPMCAGALVNSRVERLVYGCVNPKAGAVHTLYELVTDQRLNHRMDVTAGVLGDECGALLTRFFEELRRGRQS